MQRKVLESHWGRALGRAAALVAGPKPKTLILIAALLAAVSVNAAELRAVRSIRPVHGDAQAKIDRLIKRGLEPILYSLPPSAVIEPIITSMKFVSGGKRLWSGPFSGSSYVQLRIRITDQGRQTEHEIYEAAGAWKGAITVGHNDNEMLERVAERAVAYVKTYQWHYANTVRHEASGPIATDEPPSGDGDVDEFARLNDKQPRNDIDGVKEKPPQ